MSQSEAVSANDYCGDDAEGYMEVCEVGDYLYVLSSGAPNHPAEYDQAMTNPNERCKLLNILITSFRSRTYL